MKKSLLCLLAWAFIAVAAKAAAPSGTLPVMYITTENHAPITSKTDYVTATYYLDPKGVAGVEAIGSATDQQALQIRGRGNYTWTGFDKKPYRLKLGAKTALMGMEKSKHFALLAHADDSKGFLRNTLGFQASRLVGLPYTPADAPVEVVLNDEYIGLYFLTETVRVDKKRVNVYDYDSEVEDTEKALKNAKKALQDPPEGSDLAALSQAVADAEAAYAAAQAAAPGWLVEIDNYDDEEQVQFQSIDPYNREQGKVMRITYDSPSDYITEAHRTWLRNEFETMDRMIVNGNRNDCEWARKIDLTNLARFIVVQQITCNYESFHGSCKLSRDNGDADKWNFGPVWDFGSGFQDGGDFSRWFFEQGLYTNHWVRTMWEYPALRAEVERIYKEFADNDGFSKLKEYGSQFIQKISQAARADKERWPQYGNDNLSGSLDFVSGRLNQSQSFMNSALNYQGGEDDPDAPSTAIYLRGKINNWGAPEEYRFTETSKNIYTLNLASLSGEFKLAGPEWDSGNVDYGTTSNDAIGIGDQMVLTYQKGNIKADGTLTNITLTFNWATKTLSISEQGGGEIVNSTGEVTIYFRDGKANPWSTVCVYMWKNNTEHLGGWPGTEMTRVYPAANAPMMAANLNDQPGTVLWKHTFTPSEDISAAGLIFNNGSGGTGNQTDDLSYVANQVYDHNGNSEEIATFIEAIEAENPVNVKTVGGNIVVTADKGCRISIVSMDGRSRFVDVQSGETTIELPRGFYIVAGTKIVL